ncbi:MAG: PEP-CTERM sorting domain-containing protein [Myxococcota bacterium]
MLLRSLGFSFALVSILPFSPVAAGAASFTGLGGLGVPPSSLAYGVSGDGTTAVGRSASGAGNGAFVWTASTGIQSIGDIPGGQFSSIAYDASGDGAVVVGQGNDAFFLNEAMMWTASTGATGLGFLPGGNSSQANAVSNDGTKIAGQTGAGRNEAFLWDATNGMQGLGDLPGGTTNSAGLDISGDGSTVVGRSNGANGVEAFRWNAIDGMQGLGDLPGGSSSSFASGVSADGSVVVGRGSSASGFEAFRWDAIGGLQGLGDLPGGSFFSEATDVSGDGSIVVGRSNGAAGQRAILWDAANGMRELSVVLAVLGIDLTGWTLTDISAISEDGLTIVGTGTNPSGFSEGFIAVIPEPGTAILMGFGLAGLAAGRRSRIQNPPGLR